MTNLEKKDNLISEIKKYVYEVNQKFGFVELVGFDPMYETRHSNFEYTMFNTIEEERLHKKKLDEMWESFFKLSKEINESIEY